jgi:hypothetical protein
MSTPQGTGRHGPSFMARQSTEDLAKLFCRDNIHRKVRAAALAELKSRLEVAR